MQLRHSKQTQTLEERLAEEADRLRKEARGTPPGVEREGLIRRARHSETAGRDRRRRCRRNLAPAPGRIDVVAGIAGRAGHAGSATLAGKSLI
jgi:hypothetical protein